MKFKVGDLVEFDRDGKYYYLALENNFWHMDPDEVYEVADIQGPHLIFKKVGSGSWRGFSHLHFRRVGSKRLTLDKLLKLLRAPL